MYGNRWFCWSTDQVTDEEDRYWYWGQVNTSVGRFPRSHVVQVDLPSASSHCKYFATLANFSQQQPGDLSFTQGTRHSTSFQIFELTNSFVIAGAIIVGLHAVDSNWWQGRTADNREGIFPISLTWMLDISPVNVISTNLSLWSWISKFYDRL